MILMILKMSALTGLYVLLTMVLFAKLRNRRMTPGLKVLVGVIYGLCAVLSTHFGVDYGSMVLNVRDIGPLAAGLFFSPASGILAGLIGGIERYIVGTWFGIGSYTRIACSVSTCLAGFVAAAMNRWLFKGKKPSASYAFFMGAVMEVFHMYSVLLTHRDDMSMAYRVVMTCSAPMVLFTGVGMAISSAALRIMSGEWKPSLRPRSNAEIPVSHRFSAWLFVVITGILVSSFAFTYFNKTTTVRQSARDTLNDVSGDIAETYQKIQRTQSGIEALSEKMLITDVRAIADAVNQAGGAEAVDDDFLEHLRQVYGLEAVGVVRVNGVPLSAAGEPKLTSTYFPKGTEDATEGAVRQSSKRVSAWAACNGGVARAVIDTDSISDALNQAGLNDSLSFFHVGSIGTFDIISKSGYSIAGDHKDKVLAEWDIARKKCDAGETFFEAEMFKQPSLCRVERLYDDTLLLAVLPEAEIYKSRDEQAYEVALADILLFTAIYVLITLLVQRIVVKNLDLVNHSLAKITDGDLNEVVNVRDSSEFASLSDDINQTVTALKGYIAAAEKRIEKELELARSIQDAALPKNFFSSQKEFELFATMDPAKEVGGDFYDFFYVDNDHLALVIADVSGKGIPAALFMMRSKTAVRSLAETGSTPSEILYKANNTLCEGNDAEMFVTVWIGIIDLRTGLMHCANAGHEYPVLMRRGGDFELLKDKHGLALAAMEEMRFKEYELQLNPGDKLFVYTDGIPEAIDANTEQYGAERLVEKLNALKDRPMREVLPAVRQDIATFAGDVEQFDDITMLGFVYRGGAEAAEPSKEEK